LVSPLGLDLLGDLPQGDLAQRGQVLDLEEVVQRGLDALGCVDLAGAQAPDQGLGREVDEHHLVGRGEDGVGHRLPDLGARELGHLVVEALEVLDVQRGEHVDVGLEHVGDVLVALRVLEPGYVGVGEFVDQAHLGGALHDAGEVYPQARVEAALNNFFKVENLAALREVALREVAEEVESKRLVKEPLAVREERLFGSPTPPGAVHERLLALVDLKPASQRILRRAWRSSQRLDAELDLLCVRPPFRRRGR